jgi:CDP-diacylglycerol--glycerol-3-phosphate 3-phosphatidyltransferase
MGLIKIQILGCSNIFSVFISHSMILANCVKLLRIPLLFFIALLLHIDFAGSASLSIILFIICGIPDWLNGHLTRKYKIISTLGTFMDALMEKIFMIGIMISLLAFHILPLWTLFTILIVNGRKFLITTLRLVAAIQNVIITANMSGKVKTAIQLISTDIMILWFALIRDFGKW